MTVTTTHQARSSALEMSLLEKFEMEEATLPFKIFEPRSSSRFRSESLSSSSTSKLNVTVGSPVMSSYNSPQQVVSPGGGEETDGSSRCFDFTGLRRLSPRPLPSELLLASSSPSSSSMLMNQMPEATNTGTNNSNPMMAGFSGDPNLPKRLHVSNIPFRYR